LHQEDCHFLTKDVLDFLEDNPKLLEINSHFPRNYGLQESLKNDYITENDQ